MRSFFPWPNSSLIVKVISKDQDLLRSCREILGEIPDHDWIVAAGLPEETDAGGNIFIWDFEPETHLPSSVAANQSNFLFLVHRNDIAGFREQITAVEAKILLKPVTKATLQAFLVEAVASFQQRETAADAAREDRDDILQCLIQTNLRLQEYDQDRTTFLARAVHDFRAPLTALSGYCGLLLSEPLGPLSESQKEILRRMHHSANRLSRMAAAMFQLSVSRHVKRRPELRQSDIRECLEQALHEITPFADDKKIAIRADLAPCDLPIYFESGQIEQVLVNILDNACKFAPKAGSIEIRGYPFFWERRAAKCSVAHSAERRCRNSAEPNSYRIDIRDNGMEIPEEHLDRIFEEYTSYGGGRDRSGGGLGLAITRMILTQHDGRVWAENTDSGPMFTFVLPAYRQAPKKSAEFSERTA